MREDAIDEKTEIKLLILGGGDSGKSTFRKQMRIIHSENQSTLWTPQERDEFRLIIYKNMIDGINILVHCAVNIDKVPLDEETQEIAEELGLISVEDEDPDLFDEEFSDKLAHVWNHPRIQNAFAHRNEYNLGEVNVSLDSIKYYFDNLDRSANPIISTDYKPYDLDILYARLQTTQVCEEVFKFRNITFRLIDVGGQRNERKKWRVYRPPSYPRAPSTPTQHTPPLTHASRIGL